MKRSLLILLLLPSLFMFSQSEKMPAPKVLGNYVGINAGLSSGVMRDMITSPLFYTAFMPALTIDYQHFGKKSLFDFRFMTLNGYYFNFINDELSSGSGNSFDFDFTYYRLLEQSSDDEMKYYLGVSAGNFTDIRINQAFMNAALTIDNISDLALNIRADWRITRPEKQKKILWLIKYTRKEKEYLLSGKVGVPVVGLIYRPGFTNPGNSTLNDGTLLQGYAMKVKAFLGMNTDIAVSRVLENGNMIRFGYYWDCVTNGKKAINRIDMSHHVFTFGLIFKIN